MSDNENESNNRRKRTSLVWQYFEKLNSMRVKCRICLHEMRYMGNTANSLRHLKVKHEIDARAQGLEDPENVKRMKALSGCSSTLDQTIAAIKSEQQQTNSAIDHSCEEDVDNQGRTIKSSRNSISNCDEEETEVDPYCSDNEPLIDLEDTKQYKDPMMDDVRIESSSNPINSNNIDDDNHVGATATKRKTSPTLEEQRIMAETEYYREKAAYFRIQKHLAFLQAKKVKYELEQLYGRK